MGKLKELDSKTEQNGGFQKTLWQFIKFIFVSLLASLVQFVLLNLLSFIIKNYTSCYEIPFNWFVFSSTVSDGGLGYFISFNAANIAAQIVAFFVNRKKTFNADNNIPITLTVYIVFTICLLCFSAWLSPNINGFLISHGVSEVLALNISSIICSLIQFLLYFPFDKILMRKKKAD